MRKNAKGAVAKILSAKRLGDPFRTRDLRLPGYSRSTVEKVVARLVSAGTLVRVARGVLVRPERNRYVTGPVSPDLAKVIHVLVRNSGAVIQMSGAEAVLRMGLSTQVPLKLIFQTSGSGRKFKVGSMTVLLRPTAPRKLLLVGRPAGVALAALWYLGKNGVGPSTIEKIKRKLGRKEFKALARTRSRMPKWMANALGGSHE